MAVFYHAMLNQSAQLYLRARRNIQRLPDITANKVFCSHVVRKPLASDGTIQKQQRRVLGSRNDRIRDHTWQLSHIQSELRDTPRMTACAVLLAWLSLMLCTVPQTPRFHLHLWPQLFRMAVDSDLLCQSACQRGIPSVMHAFTGEGVDLVHS